MKGYFASQISDNIEETPEGFLICHDCVIGRTGRQSYKIGELNKEAADAVGLDTSKPYANVDLFRDAEDVFDADFLRSLESKPVTDDHPPDFISPNNYNEYSAGHLRNVRRGREQLDSGEYPILADVHIQAEPLLSKVKSKRVRELSLGYDYDLRRGGDKVYQSNMIGNHCAVVPRARAGSEARINDAAPPATAVAEPTPTIITKEKKPMKGGILGRILGLGVKAYAVDAEPEDLAAAVQEVNALQASTSSSRSTATDGATTTTNNGNTSHATVTDSSVKDRRGKLKDALKILMDSLEEETPEEAAMDEQSMNGLENFLASKSESEDTDDTPEDEEEDLEDGEEEEEEGEDGEEGELVAAQGGQETEASGEEELASDRRFRASDSRRRRQLVSSRGRAQDVAEGAMETLRALRPAIARSKDKRVQNAFDAALASVKRGSRVSSGSYVRVANAARSRNSMAMDSETRQIDRNKKLQDAYNAAVKGGK